MKPIHERMLVLIPKENEQLWLDPHAEGAEVQLNLLQSYPAEAMEDHPVSKPVNSPGNNSSECIKSVGPES